MHNWPILRISDVANVYDGPHATPKLVESGPIFLGIDALKNGRLDLGPTRHVSEKDFLTWTKRVTPAKDDIVFSYETKLGEAALIPDGLRCCLGRRMGLVRVDAEKVNPRFFLYQYISPEFQKFLNSRTVNGATVDRIPLKDFPDFPVRVPPIEVQKKIVATLGSLDDKIELNRRMNETLEAMAQAVFRDWFVDFGPTRRKQEGDSDPIAILGGLIPDPTRAADIAALFPATFGDNDLPEGWEGSQLSQISTLNPESWSARKHPSRVNYVDLANTKWGTIETVSSMSWEDAPSRARRVLRAGDTIVGTVRPGNGSFAFVSEEELTGSTGFAALRPTHKWYVELIYCAATASENIKRLASLADGGAYPAVRPDIVSETEISTSDERLAKAFSFLSAPLFALIEKNKIQNQTLAATRDLLLPKLMSGEIRVQDLEQLNEVD